MKKLIVFFFFFIVAAANAYVLPEMATTTVMDKSCDGFESTTKLTSSTGLNAKYVVDYSFTDQSLVATFTNFTSNDSITVILHSFSHDNGDLQCRVTSAVIPTICKFKLSKTLVYDLKIQVLPTEYQLSMETIITSKTNELIFPDVSKDNECEGNNIALTPTIKADTTLCCKI